MTEPWRIASFNVQRLSSHEIHRAARIGAFLRERACDVVALQEIEESAAHVVAEHARIAHVTFVPHVPTRKRGVALLHRMPALVADGGRLAARLGDDKGYTRIVARLGLREVEIVALHLDWISSRARTRQIDALADALGALDRPRIVLGDLNAMTIGALLRGERTDTTVASLALALGVRPPPIASPTFPSRAPRWALDWILASPPLALGAVEVCATDLSDHAAIALDVSFAEAA